MLHACERESHFFFGFHACEVFITLQLTRNNLTPALHVRHVNTIRWWHFLFFLFSFLIFVSHACYLFHCLTQDFYRVPGPRHTLVTFNHLFYFIFIFLRFWKEKKKTIIVPWIRPKVKEEKTNQSAVMFSKYLNNSLKLFTQSKPYFYITFSLIHISKKHK